MAQENITAGEFERFSDRLFTELAEIKSETKKTNGRVTKLETEMGAVRMAAILVSGAVSFIIALASFLTKFVKGS